MRWPASSIADWYLSRYPDVAASGSEPLHHFVHYGAAEGRDPEPLLRQRLVPRALSGRGELRAASAAALSADGRGRVAQSASALRRGLLRRPASRGRGQSAALPSARSASTRGWLTEKPIAIRDYLPSRRQVAGRRRTMSSSTSSSRSIADWRRPGAASTPCWPIPTGRPGG